MVPHVLEMLILKQGFIVSKLNFSGKGRWHAQDPMRKMPPTEKNRSKTKKSSRLGKKKNPRIHGFQKKCLTPNGRFLLKIFERRQNTLDSKKKLKKTEYALD